MGGKCGGDHEPKCEGGKDKPCDDDCYDGGDGALCATMFLA